MDLKIDRTKSGISKEEIGIYSKEIEKAMDRLWSGKEPMTGWVKLPMQTDSEELERILNAAIVIQEQCRELIVIGIGGSYLGTRAAVNALVGFDEVYDTGIPSDRYPSIKFAGNTMSAVYLQKLQEDIRTKEVCLCVISKSGTTIEPSIAFAVLKEAMIKKYGREEASKRIYAVTDAKKGVLREEAEREGYVSFAVPDDIGGRYSVLTPVGLLPMAAAGIDIKAMLAGAEAMATSPAWDFDAADYAAVRYALLQAGKSVEIFEYYEPQLEFFSEWLKQLFGESEGKDGKGLYPDSLRFSSDLHSMGQFLQEGRQIFFETVLNIEKPSRNIILPASAGELLGGKSLNQINRAAMEGVISAHSAAGIPIIKIDIPELNAFYFGQMLYFFETTCAVTSYLMGVNPFDQPGVEQYKAEMRKKLNELE
ncbi:glucose-6-phosphate isomerase [Aminipila luticellarii]|uniref:Glucose-6-phosphate isomerase n=1 Tax=Aminipila luticellarii TaxID=2507160 RepID=A0A410PSG6_9FIRM|nr:glucose-6-phosphate isomerase [Aminipila luticellarii]QAT41931.1 glucose-6-phosphate isomerase [Aminipila luticellarii]